MWFLGNAVGREKGWAVAGVAMHIPLCPLPGVPNPGTCGDDEVAGDETGREGYAVREHVVQPGRLSRRTAVTGLLLGLDEQGFILMRMANDVTRRCPQVSVYDHR